MNFPLFKYHPDPIASGSVAESDESCLCCDQKRGFIYTGPVYAIEDLDNKICPWCIADGSAAEKFEAVFTDEDGIGAEELAVETQEKVARRTPGFAAATSGASSAVCRTLKRANPPSGVGSSNSPARAPTVSGSDDANELRVKLNVRPATASTEALAGSERAVMAPVSRQ